MNPTAFESEAPRPMPAGTVVLAVIAPFISVAVMAAPLLFDTLRHAVGL